MFSVRTYVLLDRIHVSAGEKRFETLLPKFTSPPSAFALNEPINSNKSYLSKDSIFFTFLFELNESDAFFFSFFLCSGKEVEFSIEEDDRYYLDIINTNPRSIIMTLNLNVSSMMYDISKAKNKCSTMNGSCQLRLLFPNTHYLILTTPNTVSPATFLSAA